MNVDAIRAIETLPRPALLAIGEAVDLLAEAQADLNHGHGDPNDLTAYTNHLRDLCKKHNVDFEAAVYSFS